MIRAHADHRVLRDARRLQLLQQIRQRILQLQVGRHIGLHLGGGVGIGRLGLGPVLGRHGVTPAVAAVAADGHVIYMKRRTAVHIPIDVVPDGVLHHLQIGVGPRAVLRHLQAAAHALVVIAQVGVGLVPVVVVVDVVVVRAGAVPQRPELVAQRKGHGIIGRCVEADVAPHPGGQQARHHRILSAGGGLSPPRLVVVFAHEPLVGQLIQGGCQLLADKPGGERLRRQQHQVFPLEQAGVLVLFGGRQTAEILGHVPHRPIPGAVRQCLEINVHGVLAVYHRLRHHRRVVQRIHRLCRQHQLGLGRAEHRVFRLQPHRRVQAELRHSCVRLKVVSIAVTVCAPVGQHLTDDQKYHAHRRYKQQRPLAHPVLRHDPLAQ